MKKKYVITAVLILSIAGIIFVSWFKYSFPHFNCPDIQLHNYNQKVETKDEAINLFQQFFSEEKQYPPFNESKVYENLDLEERYIYINRYEGGILYENGILIQKGYCK